MGLKIWAAWGNELWAGRIYVFCGSDQRTANISLKFFFFFFLLRARVSYTLKLFLNQ